MDITSQLWTRTSSSDCTQLVRELGVAVDLRDEDEAGEAGVELRGAGGAAARQRATR